MKILQINASARSQGANSTRLADGITTRLKTVLGFLGLTDIELVYAEGLAMGAEAARKGLGEAEARIASIAG